MLIDYFRLAIQNITHKRLRSWLTMLGIFIGIAAVVSLIGLGQGLKFAITSQFGFIDADAITVNAGGINYGGPPGTGAVNPLTLDDVEVLKKLPGVEMVMSRLISSSTVEYKDARSSGYLVSLPEDRTRAEIEKRSGLEAAEGRLLREEDSKKIFLGSTIAEETTFDAQVRVGNRILVNDEKFEIVGIGKPTGSFITDFSILINEDELRDLINDDETVSTIALLAQPGVSLEELKERVEIELREFRDVEEGKEDFSVELSKNALDSLNSTLFAVQLFVYIIAGIAILVGGIGISNTMYTAVLERTKEIGIMKSVGAGMKDIFFIFLFESGFLGLVGGIIGVILGVLLAKGFAFAGSLALGSDLISAQISFALIFGALLFSFLIGMLAGTIPARKASKLVPVDALRT